jgi:hypothetical protein
MLDPDIESGSAILVSSVNQAKRAVFFSKIFDVVFIFRFQIQDITVVSEEDQATRSAKDALLLW